MHLPIRILLLALLLSMPVIFISGCETPAADVDVECKTEDCKNAEGLWM